MNSESVFRVLDRLAWGVFDWAEGWPTRPLRFIGIFIGMAVFAVTAPIQLALFMLLMLLEMWESTDKGHR